MKQLSVLSLIVILSSAAFAYRDGAYSCKNIQNLPNNSFKITSVAIPGSASVQAPYLEVTRYYLTSDTGSEVNQVQFSGFANVVKTKDSETLYLGSVELEFQNGELMNCKK